MHSSSPFLMPFSMSLESLYFLDTPSSPLFLFRMLSTSDSDRPASLTMNGIIDESMSPLLVPIMIPEFGVKPREVSIDLPFRTADTEPPLPMWQVIIFVSSLPRISFILIETYLWLVPWNPYFLTPYFSYHSYGTGYMYASFGSV